MNESAIALANGQGKGNPPPTDDFYPERSILRRNILEVAYLGLAVGFAFAVVFVIASLIVALNGGSGAVINFIELLYPGLVPGLFGGILIGVVLSYIYGLLFGLVLAGVYNTLIKNYVEKNEGVERYT